MTDYARILAGYVDDVLSGRVVAGRWVKLACERHRRDIERAEAGGPWIFSAKHVAHICRFVEQMPHVEGEWADRGETIELAPWQVFALGSVNGWLRRSDRARRYRTAYVEVARKNGKSALAAAVGLYYLTAGGEAGAKVYTAATKMKQARVVFDAANYMIGYDLDDQGGPMTRIRERMAELRRRYKVTVEEHKIKLGRGQSRMVPLEAKSNDGGNAHCAVVDELHEHATAAVWNALNQSRGARRQSLLLAITTAGYDTGGICYEQHSYLRMILNGAVHDDRYFGVIYAIDDEDEDPFDEACWPKANPSAPVIPTLIEDMRAEAVQAKSAPGARGTFLTKRLNRWTAAGVSAFDLARWQAGEDPGLDWEAYAGAASEGGATALDLAWKHDLAAVVTAFKRGDDLVAFGDFFATEATVAEAEHLQGWADERLLHVCPGYKIDFGQVRECAIRHARHFRSSWIAYDPHFAVQMSEELAQIFPPGTVNDFKNNLTDMNQPFQLLQAEVAEGRVVTNGSPVWRWMAANTVVKRGRDYEMPGKERDQNKIDGISALCMAYGMILSPPQQQRKSIYEERGLRAVGGRR